jgi:hypothetical protein
MRLFSMLHRGLDNVAKAIGGLTILLLVLMLVGAPVIAIFSFIIIAAAYVAHLVGGGPLATTVVFMISFIAVGMYSGIYVAPYCQPQIIKAVGALLDRAANKSTRPQ